MKISNLALVSLVCACCVGTGLLTGAVTSFMTQKKPEIMTVSANTSDRVDGYLTCTGFVDGGIEAVFVLDSTTGMLTAGVLSKMPNSGFQAKYQGNVNNDLKKAIMFINKMGASKKAGKTTRRNKKKDVAEDVAAGAAMLPSEPKYIMTSGTHDIMHQGQTKPAASALYVTECNTGLTLVYVLPWNVAAHSSGTVVSLPLTYYTVDRFLAPMVMEEEVEAE